MRYMQLAEYERVKEALFDLGFTFEKRYLHASSKDVYRVNVHFKSPTGNCHISLLVGNDGVYADAGNYEVAIISDAAWWEYHAGKKQLIPREMSSWVNQNLTPDEVIEMAKTIVANAQDLLL